MANGCITVIAHYSQEQTVSDSKPQEEEHLKSTITIGDGSEQRQQVDEHLGQNDKGVACLWNGEDPKEEVHGCVKAAVQMDDSDNNGIPTQDDQIQAQKNGK